MLAAAWGHADEATAIAKEWLPKARSYGQPTAIVVILAALGWAQLETDPPAALAALDEAIEMGGPNARHGGYAIALSMAAQLRCKSADPATAMAAVHQAIEINLDMGDRGMLVTTLERSLPVLTELGHHETTAVLGGAVTGPFARNSILPVTEHSARASALDRARSALGDDAYDKARQRGASMTYDELAEYSRELRNLTN
jgi:hypothetical protein